MGSLALETDSIHSEKYISLGLSESGNGASEFPRVLPLLSSVLERSVQKNARALESVTKEDTVTIFHGLRAPNLSIQSYIERIFKYSKCSPSCFLLSYIYIDRYLEQPGVHLTCLNVHRLLMTSVVIATKFIDDAFFNNAYYARVGGISTQEMNKLELSLLFTLDFRLQVAIATFERYCLRLEKEAAAAEAACYHIHIVERPLIQVCSRKEWTRTTNKMIEDSKRQSAAASAAALQRCSCGAV